MTRSFRSPLRAKRDQKLRDLGLNPDKLSTEQKKKLLVVWRDYPKIGPAIWDVFRVLHDTSMTEEEYARVAPVIDALVVAVAADVEARITGRTQSLLAGVEALLKLPLPL